MSENKPQVEGIEELQRYRTAEEYSAVVTARLLQSLVQSRRIHLEEFMDGDGPYWITIGIFIDEMEGVKSTLSRVVAFADESIETSWHILRILIERSIVIEQRASDGESVYTLRPSFAMQFSRFLLQQLKQIREACSQVAPPSWSKEL